MDSTGSEASSEFHLDQALKAFERARELTDVESRPDLHGVVLHDIAEVYEATGRTAEALDLYRESAQAKRRRSQSSDLLVTLLTLASRLLDHAAFDEARGVTEEAADLIARPGAEMGRSYRAGRAHSLGILFDRLGDAGEPGAHRRALEAFELSLSLYDGELEAGSCAGALREIGRLRFLLDLEQEAVESLSEAVRYYERDGDRDGQVVVLIDLGRMYQRLADRSASRTVIPSPRPPADDPSTDEPVPGPSDRAAEPAVGDAGDGRDAEDPVPH